MSSQPSIRSVTRALSVLQAVNRGGSLSMGEIARAAAVPYPTASRIVHTLVEEGMLEREPARKRYRPTALVQTLSQGFQGHGPLVRAARPHIVGLTRRVGWPISLVTHVGHRMIVQDSTHAMTSLTFNQYYPGYSMPILGSAAGKAYLAFTSAEEREMILETLDLLPPSPAQDKFAVDAFRSKIGDIVRDGFASVGRNWFTANPGKTSSLAVPLLLNGRVEGTLTLAFFAAAMSIEEAALKYLPDLRAVALAIVADLAGLHPPTAAARTV